MCFIRNKSIRNMRLKLGKNYETFKKHKQAEFHIEVFLYKKHVYKKHEAEIRQKL